MIKNKENSTHYKWGNNCDGWHLVETNTLSVIQEVMPPSTSEKLHYHNHSQQFFFILKGVATFVVENTFYEVCEGQAFHVPAKLKHRILNETTNTLEFIVTSEPKSHGDRIDL